MTQTPKQAWKARAAQGSGHAAIASVQAALGLGATIEEEYTPEIIALLWQIVAAYGILGDKAAHGHPCFFLGLLFGTKGRHYSQLYAISMFGRGAVCAARDDPAHHFLLRMLSQKVLCGNCEKQQLANASKDNTFKLCSRYKMMVYCCADCSKAHWKQHKLACSAR